MKSVFSGAFAASADVLCPPVVQHVGRLWRRDGSDVVPHGLGLKEAGEGVSHDQQ